MNKEITILGIIPARGGSKRIPCKNIKRLAGKPMIAYTIAAAQKSTMLDACIVSTDDEEIASIAQSYGADVPFLRPKKFAQNASKDIDYAQHALAWIEKNRGWKPDIIVLLPPDVPTRTAKDVDAVIRFLIDNQLDSVRTIAGPITHPPLKTLWTVKDSKKHTITPLFPKLVGLPSQQIPDYYHSIGLVYVTRAKYIKKGSLWGPRIGGYIVDPKSCIEIDDPKQLKQATMLLQKKTS